MKALLPEWMLSIRRRFRLSAATERQLLGISARSIDCGLRDAKLKDGTIVFLPISPTHIIRRVLLDDGLEAGGAYGRC